MQGRVASVDYGVEQMEQKDVEPNFDLTITLDAFLWG